MRNLIGIYSPVPQSGKSTVFEILSEIAGYEKVPFAAHIKAILSYMVQITGIPEAEAQRLVYEAKEEQIPGFPEGITARFMSQRFGTDFARETLDDNIWIRAWSNTVKSLPETCPNIVVDDVRFDNEVKAIRELGGVLWKVVRPSAQLTGSENHASEQGLEHIQFDHVIINDGSLEDLKQKVADALEFTPSVDVCSTILAADE